MIYDIIIGQTGIGRIRQTKIALDRIIQKMKILEGTTQAYVMSDGTLQQRGCPLSISLKFKLRAQHQTKPNQIKSNQVKSKQIKQCHEENEHIRRDVNKSIQKRKEREFKEQTE